jgi:hypothetical protein
VRGWQRTFSAPARRRFLARSTCDSLPLDMVTLHVNGKKHEVDAAPDTPQRWVLRGMALCAACIAAAAGAAG